MEAFLSSTLIKEVLSSDKNKRRFVEGYLPYQEEKIPYSDIYKKMDTVDEVIQDTLRDLMYHNLGKIKPIYKDVLDIDLGDIKKIMKAVPYISRQLILAGNSIVVDVMTAIFKKLFI